MEALGNHHIDYGDIELSSRDKLITLGKHETEMKRFSTSEPLMTSNQKGPGRNPVSLDSHFNDVLSLHVM